MPASHALLAALVFIASPRLDPPSARQPGRIELDWPPRPSAGVRVREPAAKEGMSQGRDLRPRYDPLARSVWPADPNRATRGAVPLIGARLRFGAAPE